MSHLYSLNSLFRADTLRGYSEPSGASFVIENRLLCESVLSIADTGQEVTLLN